MSARRPNEPVRWENGITYEPECIGSDPDPHAVECGSEAYGLTGQDPSATVEWDTYGLHKPYRCTTHAARGKDWDAIARRRLEAATDRMLGRELWRGTKARAESYPNRFLASNDADTLSGASGLTPLNALACLEQYLAECNGGGPGMIHASSQVATHWIENGKVRREGNTLVTELGTIVVRSPGYDGSGPAAEGAADVPVAAADGSVWAYATGIVDVRLGPVLTIGNPLANPEQVDHTGSGTSNRGLVIAHRVALASWDLCCHGAAEIDVALCLVGGAS